MKAGSGILAAAKQAWANGAYEFTLLVNGTSAGSQMIVVGGAAENRSQFSDIVFGTLDQTGTLVGNGSILPLGDIASARFLYANMQEGVTWSAIWYYSGAEVARTADGWSDPSHGAKVIRVAPNGGLLPGPYRLELYIDDALSATSDFIVAGRPAGPLPEIFSNIRHTTADTPLNSACGNCCVKLFQVQYRRYMLYSIGSRSRLALRGRCAGWWMIRSSSNPPVLGRQSTPALISPYRSRGHRTATTSFNFW